MILPLETLNLLPQLFNLESCSSLYWSWNVTHCCLLKIVQYVHTLYICNMLIVQGITKKP
jgi:hypothetical protein